MVPCRAERKGVARAVVALACANLAVACSGEHQLSVVVVSDVADAAGAQTIRVEVASSPFETFQTGAVYELIPGDDLLSGVEAASLPALAADNYFVTVSLLDGAATALGHRTVLLQLESDLSLQVAVTADCAGVTCPGPADASDRGECLAGQCINSSCSSVFPAACPNTCVADVDCSTPAPCGRSRCIEGVCLSRENGCLPAERCDDTLGCVSDG